MALLKIVYILLFIMVTLIAYAVMQIKLAGMNIKDFWTFIEANQTLDKLYQFAKKYEKLTVQQQIIYLKQAEEIFDAFEKVPSIIWEEEYEKYTEVLDRYKDIKMMRWISNS